MKLFFFFFYWGLEKQTVSGESYSSAIVFPMHSVPSRIRLRVFHRLVPTKRAETRVAPSCEKRLDSSSLTPQKPDRRVRMPYKYLPVKAKMKRMSWWHADGWNFHHLSRSSFFPLICRWVFLVSPKALTIIQQRAGRTFCTNVMTVSYRRLQFSSSPSFITPLQNSQNHSCVHERLSGLGQNKNWNDLRVSGHQTGNVVCRVPLPCSSTNQPLQRET